jgi:hypothetical protein
MELGMRANPDLADLDLANFDLANFDLAKARLKRSWERSVRVEVQ